MKAWADFWRECRLALAETLLWQAIEVLPPGVEKREVAEFLIEYGKRRALEDARNL